MLKSHTTPVTASSFPKWKSNNKRHVVDGITGEEFYFEQDPRSLKWYDVTSEMETLNIEEGQTESDGNKTMSQSSDSSHNVPVPVTLFKSVNTVSEILPKYRKKCLQESKKKRLICETSTSSMVDIMSLVQKHLNKSKTNVANRNVNFKNVGAEFVKKNMKSETVSSCSTSTSESNRIRIKQEPFSSYTGQSDQEPSSCYTGEIEQGPFGHIAGVIDQEPSSYYTGEIEQEPSNAYIANIREKHSNIDSVKIKQEPSSFEIVNIKKEPLDSDAMQTDSQENMQFELLVSPSTSSTSLDESIISNTLRQPVSESQGTSFNKNDTLQDVKLELTRIDDIFNFENKSSVILNSPNWTAKKPVKKDCSASDRPLSSKKAAISHQKALELRYQCFSAERSSDSVKLPDAKVLYNKNKLCRHSNRFQNFETIECGCVRQSYLTCDVCGLVLPNFVFEEHVKTHYRIKRYRCPKCGKMYKLAGQFDKHYRFSHCKIQKYQCFKCQEVFKRFCSLRRHLDSCTDNILHINK